MTKPTRHEPNHAPLNVIDNAMAWQAAAAEARLSRNNADSIGSHWEGCWRSEDHHACAVARCERVERELARTKNELELAKSAMRWMPDVIAGYDKQWDRRHEYIRDLRTTIKGLCRRLRLLRRYRDIPIGANIRAMRKRWGLTVGEFARWAGMAPSDLAAIERGLVIPDSRTMLRICRQFGCTIDVIMHGPHDDARRWARLWKKFARKVWRQNRALTRKGE